jgi:hypothetical protein
MAVKTFAVLAVPFIGSLPISTAHAASKRTSATGFYISPEPCGTRYAVSYEACRKWVVDHGENATAA